MSRGGGGRQLRSLECLLDSLEAGLIYGFGASIGWVTEDIDTIKKCQVDDRPPFHIEPSGGIDQGVHSSPLQRGCCRSAAFSLTVETINPFGLTVKPNGLDFNKFSQGVSTTLFDMATYDGMEFPLKLKTLMRDRRMSQEQLARELGVSQNLISLWSRGKSLPDLKEAATMAGVLGVPLAFLADDAKDEPPPSSDLSEDERMVLRTFRAAAETHGLTADEAVLRLAAEKPKRDPATGRSVEQPKNRLKDAAG